MGARLTAARMWRRTLGLGARAVDALAFEYGGQVMPPRHPWDLELPPNVYPVDLLASKDGEPGGAARVEVKCDTRTSTASPNMYLERWVRTPAGVVNPGGPWRAAADGCHLFVYCYADGWCLWFGGLSGWCAALDRAAASDALGRRHQTRNADGRVAFGRVVPRADVVACAGACVTTHLPSAIDPAVVSGTPPVFP